MLRMEGNAVNTAQNSVGPTRKSMTFVTKIHGCSGKERVVAAVFRVKIMKGNSALNGTNCDSVL
eukprot:m.153947 g.153947  ORF g.153947 m.153947 type:complete len:64 (-) comp24613_c0_seq2:329-520(-)